MSRIQKHPHTKSLKTLFILYTLVCILSALLMSLLFSELCRFGQAEISGKYTAVYRNSDYLAEVEMRDRVDGRLHGTLLFWTGNLHSLFTPEDLFFYNTLGFLSIAVFPACFVFCICVTSLLFYKRQLLEPLEVLNRAADNIADNNLDFQIACPTQNELGRLCSSFEKMRAALQHNHVEMWRQIEERKRLNAAFSHDLRTPLTVLKGQSEMLINYAPRMPEEKLLSTVRMMQRHITRLELYVNTMNSMQRLEDIEINRTTLAVRDAIRQMRSTGVSVCMNRKFEFGDETRNLPELYLDFSVLMRVYENLLSNAARYAREKMTVSVRTEGVLFLLTVSDDGKGFTQEELTAAVKPFYSSAAESDGLHFGMGLNICKILCEKHGGYLTLENHPGASVTAAFSQASSPGSA